MDLIRRFGQRLNAIFEPIWWGINDATGMTWLNRKLTLRRTYKDLELARQLRAAGMTEQADQLADTATRRLLAR